MKKPAKDPVNPAHYKGDLVPCPCGYADCDSKYRELADGVRTGVWRKP